MSCALLSYEVQLSVKGIFVEPLFAVEPGVAPAKASVYLFLNVTTLEDSFIPEDYLGCV